MLEKLRRFDCARMDMEELIELSSYTRALWLEFGYLGVPAPEWLETRTRELRREIVSRNQDALEARLRELKARREALAPAEEKRTKLDEEIAALEQKLTPATS